MFFGSGSQSFPLPKNFANKTNFVIEEQLALVTAREFAMVDENGDGLVKFSKVSVMKS